MGKLRGSSRGFGRGQGSYPLRCSNSAARITDFILLEAVSAGLRLPSFGLFPNSRTTKDKKSLGETHEVSFVKLCVLRGQRIFQPSVKLFPGCRLFGSHTASTDIGGEIVLALDRP